MAPSLTISTAQPELRLARALSDLRDGFGRRALWMSLGWLEIKQRYRRSMIGPFWLTLSVGIFVIGLGAIYSSLFRMDVRDYIPFLSASIVLWTLISSNITEGCYVFVHSEGIIKQLNAPISTHVYRLVWRNLLIFAHNIVIYVFVLAYFGINPGLTPLLALPGLVIVCIAGFGLALAAGVLSARFRDIPPIISNLVQVLFFLTPVIWKPEVLTDRVLVVTLNPFFYLLEIVRAPLLGSVPPLSHWAIALSFAFTCVALAFAIFVRFRGRIAYWL